MKLKRTALPVLVSLIVSYSAISQTKESLSIVSYNVMYGFNHGTAEKNAIQWIQKEKPDIIAFQELKGYSKTRFKELAQKWQHNYSYLWERTRASQPIAISSNAPITSVKEIKKKKSDRGYLIAESNGIHFIIVHLHPNNRNKRAQELQSILQSCDSLTKLQRDFCVLGDFNAMLPSDKDYADTHLKPRLANRIKKGKCGDLNTTCLDWDYTVLQKITKTNWVDVIGLHLLNKEKYIKENRYGTFPSTASENISSIEVRNQHLHRLDHVFMNPRIAEKVIDARIFQEPQQEIISDHYPVRVRLSRYVK